MRAPMRPDLTEPMTGVCALPIQLDRDGRWPGRRYAVWMAARDTGHQHGPRDVQAGYCRRLRDSSAASRPEAV